MLCCSCDPPLVREPRDEVGDGRRVPPAAESGSAPDARQALGFHIALREI
jgi:hypothetical protein